MILISLISDQTIPNLLFIKEFGNNADKFVFISTRLMKQKNKTDHLVDAAGINIDKCDEIILPDENDPKDINELLKKHFQGNDRYVVNITCGNKIMFMVAHNYFTSSGNLVYYMPIGKNYFIDLNNTENIMEVKTRLNLREYLSAYGVSYNSFPKNKISNFHILKQIYKEYRNNGYNPEKVAGLRDNEHKQFFTGEWFEQYVYYLLKKQFKLSEENIEIQLKINNLPQPQRSGSDNELDVVFTMNNELYVIEAKVSIGIKRISKKFLDNILFKLSAINKNFGLRSNAWVVTLADFNWESENFKKDLKRKLIILGISGIEDREKIKQGSLSLKKDEALYI